MVKGGVKGEVMPCFFTPTDAIAMILLIVVLKGRVLVIHLLFSACYKHKIMEVPCV